MAGTQTLFYTTSCHEDSFLGRQYHLVQKMSWREPSSTDHYWGGKGGLLLNVLWCVFFSWIVSFPIPSVISIFAVTVDFLISLLFPVICFSLNLWSSPFVAPVGGVRGGATCGFSGSTKLQNTIPKPWHHDRRKNCRSWRCWIYTTSWSLCYLTDGLPCSFLLLRDVKFYPFLSETF